MKKLNSLVLLTLCYFIGACSPATRSTQSLQQGANAPQPSTNQVNLNWSSNLGEQQGFYIEESSDGVNFSQILNVPDGTNTAQVTFPSKGVTYYFRIRGYNQAGDSPYTAVVSASI